jgi:hypothetical protein
MASADGRRAVDLEVAQGLEAIVYAMFALQQDLPLEELHPVGSAVGLHAHQRSETPEWFAAAASEDASLLETAPELLAMYAQSTQDDPDQAVLPGSDIIGIYAPDAPSYRRPSLVPPVIEVIDEDDAEEVQTEGDSTHAPRTSVQMGLLKELSDLDS